MVLVWAHGPGGTILQPSMRCARWTLGDLKKKKIDPVLTVLTSISWEVGMCLLSSETEKGRQNQKEMKKSDREKE